MPPYAGFKDLGDYLEQRRRQLAPTLNLGQLSSRLFGGQARGYLYAAALGRVREPSRARMMKIAAFFEDDPAIILTLVGLQFPPPDAMDREIQELVMLLETLPATKQKQVLQYIRLLTRE